MLGSLHAEYAPPEPTGPWQIGIPLGCGKQCSVDIQTRPGFSGLHVPPPEELELLDELDELDELELLDELDELELLDELDELDELDPDELDALDALEALDELDEGSPLELDETEEEFPDPAVPLDDDTEPPPLLDELLPTPFSPPVSPSSVSSGAPSKVEPSAQCSKNNDVRPKKIGSASFFTITDRTWQCAERKRKRANCQLRYLRNFSLGVF